MTTYLFAGVSVSDLAAARSWYDKLFGTEPFLPNDREAVWEVAESRFVYIELRPEHAGHSHATIFLDDLDAAEAAIAGRGLTPARREQYENGVRKFLYVDPDGNEVGYGGN